VELHPATSRADNESVTDADPDVRRPTGSKGLTLTMSSERKPLMPNDVTQVTGTDEDGANQINLDVLAQLGPPKEPKPESKTAGSLPSFVFSRAMADLRLSLDRMCWFADDPLFR
jgi:hypothetical protein